jgi:hypothetical protein
LVREHVPVEDVTDLDGRDRDGAGRQRLGGRVGREAAAEEQEHPAEHRRCQHRQTDVTPVPPRRRTEIRRRFAPRFFQSGEGRRDDEHHQGHLEIHVDEGDAPELIEIEAVVPRIETDVGQPVGSNSRQGAETRDEHESEIHATELRQDTRAGRGESFEQRVIRRGDGVREERTEDARDDRGDKGQLQAVLEAGSILAAHENACVDMAGRQDGPEIGQRQFSLVRTERQVDDRDRRKE